MRLLGMMLCFVMLSSASLLAAPAGIVTLSRKNLGRGVTGKVRDVDLDHLKVEIAEAPPLGNLRERNAPLIPKKPLRKVGQIDGTTLAREVTEQFRDFELCRIKVARAANIPLLDVRAGQISLHWTILPTGGTRGTLLFEQTETDLALMKCSRRRMNAWHFTPPKGGPIDVEYDYDFSPG